VTAPGAEEDQEPRWVTLAVPVGDAHQADVIVFHGQIDQGGADNLIRIAKRPDRRKNVVVLLTTRGGSADAAFRMARCLQTHYAKLLLFIHDTCRSAGTLVAIGADEIVLSEFGKFGPLDVLLDTTDGMFEGASGLDVAQALTSLNQRTYRFYETVLASIRRGSRGLISHRLAAQMASRLAVGAYSDIYQQLDPIQLGHIERAMQIAKEYGERLERHNLREGAIRRLATGYPSQRFVIDLKEAKTLFHHVRAPSSIEEELGECISVVTRDATDDSYVELLNVPRGRDGE
jgi:hypothetical protein